MRLNGKTALVTGAGSGIGKCIAEIYAREGARVALADINGDAAKSAARAIGNNAIALACDVSKKADIDLTVEETFAAFGALDILVNNAGATHVNKPVQEIDEPEFDRNLRHQREGSFPRLPSGGPDFSQARRRRDHQYRFHCRVASTAGAFGL